MNDIFIHKHSAILIDKDSFRENECTQAEGLFGVSVSFHNHQHKVIKWYR